ncbi:hypothetical protein J6S88_07215 [bacterium]|nr:hypothetical protein [bacterium]
MRILEIKNNLIKISYDVNDNLALSGFAIVEDTNCPYVAQIVNLKADGGNNFAILKLLFTFDETGVLKNYNGTIPSENAKITLLPVNEILNLLSSDSPIFLGEIAQTSASFSIDLGVFTSGLLICSNSLENSGKLLTNIFPQLIKRNKKAIILDTTGDYYSENSFVFGKDFKLALNADFLDFIFDNDLDGVEPVSKAVIQDIFSEVKEYLRTDPKGYLPIDLLLNVVQDQYNQTKIPELILLKNKLLRYQQENVFASDKDDVFMLRSKVVHHDSLVIDISQAEPELMRKIIGYIYDMIATVDSEICVFATMNNDFADKKVLRKTMEFSNIYTTVICPHEFKYLPDLKQIMPNIILFAPQTTQHDFAAYNTFLGKLNGDEFVVYGDCTQKIPFIVQLTEYEEPEHEEFATAKDENSLTDNYETQDFSDEYAYDENSDNLSQTEFNNENIFSDNTEEEITEDVSEETSFEEVSEDETVAPEEVSAEDENSFERDVMTERELLEEQVANDVDASFYKKIEEENLDDENRVNPEVLAGDDNITDEDLDYIEALNISENEQQNEETEEIEIVEPQEETDENEPVIIEPAEESFLEENTLVLDETSEEANAEVPIYTPEEFSNNAPEEDKYMFQAGDLISHPKYGQGVVEKMINYGNKTLCSINFVNLGRRLLDPTISDLELVSRDGAVAE